MLSQRRQFGWQVLYCKKEVYVPSLIYVREKGFARSQTMKIAACKSNDDEDD